MAEDWVSRQLLEVESLCAIYFEEGAVRVEEAALNSLRENADRDQLAPLSLSVRLPVSLSNGECDLQVLGLRLAAVLPHGYPGEGEGPTIWLEPELNVENDESAFLSPDHTILVSLADDDGLCGELQAAAHELAICGEECLLPLVQQATSSVEERLAVFHASAAEKSVTTEDDERVAMELLQEELISSNGPSLGNVIVQDRIRVLGRRAMFSHHIIADSKRQAIKDWAIQLGLGGLAKIGWPGVIIVEGDEQNVRLYVDALSRLRWKHFVVRGEETVDVLPGQRLEDQLCLAECSFREFGPDAMSEFASTCRQLGLEELFLMALKLSGSSDKGKKDRTKDGDRKVGKGMSSRQGRH